MAEIQRTAAERAAVMARTPPAGDEARSAASAAGAETETG